MSKSAQMPKLTVLMTVYNGEAHLHESIDSILRQTFGAFEFVIVNDGSTDRTRELILSYDDPRIRLVDNPSRIGLTRSLNRGIRAARGDFIARQDADDVSEPDRLAKQFQFMETHGEVALLGTGYYKIDVRGARIGTRGLPCNLTQIRWCLLFFCPFVHSSVMFRRALVLERVGLYNEAFAYAQDYELWSRIARRLAVANLAEPLVQYRMTPSSMTATYGAAVDGEIFRVRTANLALLLGSSKAEAITQERLHFQVLVSLLFGDYGHVRPREALRAVRTISELHGAFCRYYGVDGRESQTRQREICFHLASRMVDIAEIADDRGADGGLTLLVSACRLYTPVALEKKLLSLSLRLLTRPLRRIRRVARSHES